MGAKFLPKQMFHYTRFITPKRVTSLRGSSPRHCAWATQLFSKKCRSGVESHWQLCLRFDHYDLTGLRFEHHTSRSRDEHITARKNVAFASNTLLKIVDPVTKLRS